MIPDASTIFWCSFPIVFYVFKEDEKHSKFYVVRPELSFFSILLRTDKKKRSSGPETLATPTRRYCKGWYISQFASHWNFMILIPRPWNSRIDTQNDAIFERGDTPINPIIFCVFTSMFRVFQGCIRWVQKNTYCTFTTEPLFADTNKHQVDRNFTVGVFISNPTPIGVRFAYTLRSD